MSGASQIFSLPLCNKKRCNVDNIPEYFKLDRNTTTLVDVAEDAIKNYIVTNNLHSGDPMPFESELVQMLGVGRNVVREALSRLKSRGILSSRKHKGMIVQEPDVNAEIRKAIIPQLLSKQAMIDLLELRYTLELGLVPTLFSHISDADIEDLREILESEVVHEDKSSIEYEQKFHSRIYSISANKVIIDLQGMLIPLFSYIHDIFEDFAKFNAVIKSQNLKASHADLFNSIAARDPERYSEMIKRHLMAYRLYVDEFRNSQ